MPGDWAFWLAGFALALGGAALLTWALLGDWFKHGGKLRRCPKCWYDLSGTGSLTCPECGRTFRREKKLHRSRRWWRWVVASTLVFTLAGVSALMPKMRRDGLLSVMPTDVVILALRLPDDTPAFIELERRTKNDIGIVNPTSMATGFDVFDPSTVRERHMRAIGDACVEKLNAATTPDRKRLLMRWLNTSSLLIEDQSVTEQYFRTLVLLLDDADPSVRHDAAFYAADGRRAQESVDAIRPLLEDPLPRVRTAAVAGLRLVAAYDSAPTEALIDCLKHDDVDVREHATGALGAMAWFYGTATDEAFSALVSTYQNDENMKVRAQALNSICRFQNRIDEGIALLRSAAVHSDSELRAAALSTVSMMDQFDVAFETEIAIAGVQDESAEVRANAEWLLTYRIPPENLKPHQELFETLMKSEDPFLSEVGRVVLIRI